MTTTSFALLGLLAIKDWSTYELARQLPRSVGLVWPRAEARLYGEAKRLAEAGMATTRSEPLGRRPRTVYAITEEGRAALAEWLTRPGAGPVVEFEAMVKVAFAEFGTRDDLMAHLTRIADDARAMIAVGEAVAQAYLAGTGAFPERLHVSGLAWRYMNDQQRMLLGWAEWALAEVGSWPAVDAPPGGPLAAFTRYQAGRI